MEEKELTPEQLQEFVQNNNFESFEDMQSSLVQSEEKDISDKPEEQSTENLNNVSNPDETEDTSKETDTSTSTEISDAEFRRIVTSKFKANGKEIEVTDANDIVRLMQFGSNYHKKMAELAPNRKLLKALNDNGLLSEDKVNDLIAIAKGDKAAIANLIKQFEIDTYDLPDLEENPYQRRDYIPSEESITWDEVKTDMMSSQSGKEVLSYLANIDLDSFQMVREDPTIMQTLREHVDSGIFKETMDKIDYLRMTGNLPEYDSEGNKYKQLDVYAYYAKQIEENKKAIQQKVIGNNRVTQDPNNSINQQKQSASIPNQQKASYSGLPEMITTDEFNKFDTWEDFLKANNLQ